jgi:hypothetical protein
LEEQPATLSTGAKLTAKIVMLGMANKIEWAIESVDAPRSLVLSGTGMAGVLISQQWLFAGLRPAADW